VHDIFSDAFIQSRPKSVSSFAEKAARKYDEYPDAVKPLSDLCGARVILQTVEQVAAVWQFIEATCATKFLGEWCIWTTKQNS
jgi:ppGpp synthetase/RelA/SpoT-type nucleotidyltranferase